MHQQRRTATLSPNRSSSAGHRSGVSGRVVSFMLSSLSSSAGGAQHRKKGRRRSRLDRTQNLEALRLIQLDIGRVGGFEVSREMIPVAAAKGFPQERRPAALALMGGIDADQRQVPVRVARMVARHLFEDGGKIGFASFR